MMEEQFGGTKSLISILKIGIRLPSKNHCQSVTRLAKNLCDATLVTSATALHKTPFQNRRNLVILFRQESLYHLQIGSKDSTLKKISNGVYFYVLVYGNCK
jgi:hypothetical protein